MSFMNMSLAKIGLNEHNSCFSRNVDNKEDLNTRNFHRNNRKYCSGILLFKS